MRRFPFIVSLKSYSTGAVFSLCKRQAVPFSLDGVMAGPRGTVFGLFGVLPFLSLSHTHTRVVLGILPLTYTVRKFLYVSAGNDTNY